MVRVELVFFSRMNKFDNGRLCSEDYSMLRCETMSKFIHGLNEYKIGDNTNDSLFFWEFFSFDFHLEWNINFPDKARARVVLADIEFTTQKKWNKTLAVRMRSAHCTFSHAQHNVPVPCIPIACPYWIVVLHTFAVGLPKCKTKINYVSCRHS